ncbi:MAG TPA: hypothetical protein VF172_10760 [Nitrososphaera sp.]
MDNGDQGIEKKKGKKSYLDRMAATANGLGVPFSLAREIAKNVSYESKSAQSRDKRRKQKTVTARRVRKIIIKELGERSQ